MNIIAMTLTEVANGGIEKLQHQLFVARCVEVGLAMALIFMIVLFAREK